MAGMADDVIAVLDQAAVDTAVVVGISMGGMIAQHVALRHPARVRGLVLLATSAGVSMAGLPEPATLLRLLSLPFGGAGASVNLGRLLLPPSKWHRAKEIFHDWPAAANEHPTHPRTFAMHLFAASTHLVASRLHEIQCAALVVAGELDSLLPIANSRVLARKIPRGELEIIPDAGHAIFAEDRDLVRRLLLRLERMDSP
jgi:pimeloyl-ACP methyl ester carboxylesterase